MDTVSEMYKNLPSLFSANMNPSRDWEGGKKVEKEEAGETIHTKGLFLTPELQSALVSHYSQNQGLCRGH